jgi:hypothetical protein
MKGAGMTTDRHDPDAAAEVRARALRVAGYILKLELAPVRWDRLAGTVEAAIAAASAGDLDGLRQATAELEQTRAARVLRIGGIPAGPPPPPVRERVAVLQTTLTAGFGERPAGERDGAADRDGASDPGAPSTGWRPGGRSPESG